MKEKFSIFSPTSSKSEALETSINFKKSPIKFAVYEPDLRSKDAPKYNGYQSLSTTNLDHLKKLPHEYSNLRQTLSYKTADFDSYAHEDERDRPQKPSNILRQTINMKPAFKPRSEKTFTEGFSSHEIGAAHDHPRNELAATLGYSKVSSFNLAESKSSNVLYDGRNPPKKQPEAKRTEEKTGEWKESSRWRPEEKFREFKESQQHSKIVEQIQLLKKIAGKHTEEDEKELKDLKEHKELKEHKLAMERKFSEKANYSSYTPQS